MSPINSLKGMENSNNARNRKRFSFRLSVCVICGYSFTIFRTGKSSIERIRALSASFWWFKTEFENSFEIMRSNRMCWVYRPCLETQSAHYNYFWGIIIGKCFWSVNSTITLLDIITKYGISVCLHMALGWMDLVCFLFW